MQDGFWPDTPVRASAARVILDGESVDVDTVSLTSEMTTDLSVTSPSSLASTDGSVTWPQQSLVSTTAPQPFLRQGDWPPAPRTPLTVEVGDGTQWWQQIVGYVDTSSGDIVDAQIASGLIDYVDHLSRPVTHVPLLSPHPPYDDDGNVLRWHGLYGTYVTDLAARTAGFYVTPPATAETVLSVPNMGSTWPEVGDLFNSHYLGAPTSNIPFRVSPWGTVATHPEVTWIPAGTSLRMAFTVFLDAAGGVRLSAYDSVSNVGIWLDHSTTDTLTVGLTLPGSSSVSRLTVPANGVTRAALWYRNAAGTDMALVLRLSDGREFILDPEPVSVWADVTLNRVRMSGAGSMGAVTVDRVGDVPALAWRALNHVPNAVMNFTDSQMHVLAAMPTLRGQSALSMLTEQARAECASLWIDSRGRLRWASRSSLDTALPAVTKTTDLTIDNLTWVDNLADIREEVVIRYQLPAIKRSRSSTIDLITPQPITLANDQVDESWIEPSGSDDWIEPFMPPIKIVSPFGGLGFGSKYGGVVATDDSDVNDEQWAQSGQIIVTVSQVGEAYKVTTTALNLPSGRVLTTRTRANAGPQSNRPLPFIRGRGLVSWVTSEKTYQAAVTAPTVTYDHDCSWYVQNAAMRDAIAAWIVARISTPAPTLTAVEIDPDPRIELGDKVRLIDANRTGLGLDLIVTGIRQQWGSGAPTMTLSGRVVTKWLQAQLPPSTDRWAALEAGWKANT